MNYEELLKFLSPSLSFFNQIFASKERFFEDVYQQTLAQDYVTDEFLEKILLREENFPTGLDLGSIGAAIPHTDAEYIKEEFVAVYVLDEPVTFQSMEDISQVVPVSIVFVLGLKEAHSQLEMLQTLIQLMQDENLIGKFKELNDFEELQLLLN